MPGLYKDEAIVLKTIKLGEADRIVPLYPRANGKVRAVAKGIRKTKSRFGARLEPFTHASLMIYRGRNLDTITSADIVSSFDVVRRDYERLTAASALAEIVEKITPERERAHSVYDLLLGGLRALVVDRGGTVVPAFLVKLLSLSGYHPELRACAGCGGLGPALGGAVCEACWRMDRDSLRLATDRIELLLKLLSSDFGVTADRDATFDLMIALRAYTEFHLERPLKSISLLAAS